MTPPASRFWLARRSGLADPWRGVLGYALFTFAVFLVALLYGLPHDMIARRAIDEATSEMPVRLAFDDVSFSFPNGYELRNVRVSQRDQPQVGIDISEITVSTPMLGILLGRIYSVDFVGSLYGGSFRGSSETTDGRIATQVSLEGVELAPLSRRLLPPPAAVDGTVSLDLELAGDGRSMRTAEGSVALRAQNVSLRSIVAQGFTVPDLTFQTVRLDAGIQGTRVQVDDLHASGDEVTLAGKGDVLVREPSEQSVLNVQFDIDVSQTARPGLRVATSLLPPRTEGQGKGWSLRGSLAAPSIR